MKERIAALADLLMGAAHADHRLEGSEKAAVRRLLREVLGEAGLPMDVDFRIEEFSPAKFDLATTAAVFAGDSRDEKRKLLRLVAAVHAADEEYDLDEDEYVAHAGAALGLLPEDYADLVAEIVESITLAPEDLAFLRGG